jgi:threonine dehydrogenase-like Zn-dependent dehydrogenase
MRALPWHGKRDVRVEDVPDPKIEEPTDAIIEITSSGLCGSDLHLYEVLGPYLHPGDILGHEPMGIVQEVGSGVSDIKVGDRVVVPFQISCGSCFMCSEGLQTQCETTQVRRPRQGQGSTVLLRLRPRRRPRGRHHRCRRRHRPRHRHHEGQGRAPPAGHRR